MDEQGHSNGNDGADSRGPVDRSSYPVHKTVLHAAEDESYVMSLTPSERVLMVWPLTLAAWGFKEGLVDEPRLQRPVVCVVRRKH